MNVIQQNENVSIVVVGNFDPTKLTPKWLYELKIITADEWNGQERNLLVSSPITKFKFGEIEFLSQPNRIQLISNDISESNHLVNMVTNILNNYGETEYKAVGINAGQTFTFLNSEDSLSFGKYLSNLDALNTFFKEPRLRTVTFESNEPATSETPKTSILIQAENQVESRSVPAEDSDVEVNQDLVPICSIQINNHFQVENIDQALNVINKAEVLHNEFREKSASFFNSIE